MLDMVTGWRDDPQVVLNVCDFAVLKIFIPGVGLIETAAKKWCFYFKC